MLQTLVIVANPGKSPIVKYLPPTGGVVEHAEMMLELRKLHPEAVILPGQVIETGQLWLQTEKELLSRMKHILGQEEIAL